MSLAEVVGQEQVTKVLENSLKQGKISHAYLFIGPRGTGKTSVARIFAHEVNGFSYEIEDDYVDIIEIDGASNRGIDNIRELREKVAIAPTAGKYKVYIIDEVHMLTKEAFNALLKTLEEPPEHAIFIMATTDAYKVPVTITSRAQTYTFRLATPEVMLKHLKSVATKEKIPIDDDALEIIVRRGGGSFRDSLSLLDQISTLSDKQITKELVTRAMGLPEDDKIADLLSTYETSDISSISEELRELLSSGVKPETIAEEMILQILESPKSEMMNLLAKLPDVKAPFSEAKLLVALTRVDSVAIPVAPARTTPIKTAPVKPIAAAKPVVTTTSNKETAPVEPSKTEISTSAPSTVPNGEFEWQNFLAAVNAINDAIGSQVAKCKYETVGNELHLYPPRNVTKTIISREANKKILIEAADGYRVQIHEINEKPGNAKEDGLLSRISDIMGGEVKNDGGNNPF